MFLFSKLYYYLHDNVVIKTFIQNHKIVPPNKKISTAVKITTVLKITHKSVVFLMCREFGGDLYHSHDRIHVIVYAQDTPDPCTVHAHGLVLVGIPDAQAVRRLSP